ncbi:MAG: hypothetical protein RLN62_03995 [Rickettsiales bacterium]
MEALKLLKDLSILIQVTATIAKTVVDFGQYIYKKFFSSESKEASESDGKAEMISNSVFSTQIIEEISIFKDENGEQKTTISRKIMKKYTNPDARKVANDNSNDEDIEQPKEGLVDNSRVADMLCNGNSADKPYCRSPANDVRIAGEAPNMGFAEDVA